jgi:dihydroorotate dehydrogenase electron transfer subunit
MKTSLPKVAQVKRIIKENFRTKTFVLDQKIKAKPGQFIMVWLPQKAEKPFSLTDNNPLTITVMSVGAFTKTLNNQIKIGDKVWYRGPFGKGTFKSVSGKKIFVSGGCGCVPLYFLGENIKDKKNIKVIVGAQRKDELLFEKKFIQLGLKVITVTNDGSKGKKGLTTDVLKSILKSEKINCVYACGPEKMLEKIAYLCDQFKTKYQLSMEALIKCGFGICGSCSREGKLVCLDGPVFKKWPLNKGG